MPGPVGSFRLGLTPDFKQVEIFHCNLALLEAVKEMSAKRGGKIRPLNFWHDPRRLLVTEGKARKFLFDAAALGGIGGLFQAVGECEKGFLFRFLGAETGFD